MPFSHDSSTHVSGSLPSAGLQAPRKRAGAPNAAELAAAVAAAEGMMAIGSLERAVSGTATLADVGAISWLTLRTLAPCTSMAVFIVDEANDAVVARYTAGAHSRYLHEIQVARGQGHAGWTARTRRTKVNGDPALDLGTAIGTFDPPLLSCLTVPLIYDGCLLGVLALYASTENAFTAHQQRLVELLAPSLGVTVASVVEYQEPVPVPRAARPSSRSHLRLVQKD